MFCRNLAKELHVNLIFLEVCLSRNSITRVIHVFATLYKYFRALQNMNIL